MASPSVDAHHHHHHHHHHSEHSVHHHHHHGGDGGGGSAGGGVKYMVVEKGPRDEASYTWNRLGLSINSSPALRHLLKPDEVSHKPLASRGCL